MSDRTLELTELAARDLRQILAHISEGDPNAAARQVQAIRSVLETVLLPYPEAGRILTADPERRSFLKDRYRVVYRVENERVLVLRIVHTSRDFDRIMENMDAPDPTD